MSNSSNIEDLGSLITVLWSLSMILIGVSAHVIIKALNEIRDELRRHRP